MYLAAGSLILPYMLVLFHILLFSFTFYCIFFHIGFRAQVLDSFLCLMSKKRKGKRKERDVVMTRQYFVSKQVSSHKTAMAHAHCTHTAIRQYIAIMARYHHRQRKSTPSSLATAFIIASLLNVSLARSITAVSSFLSDTQEYK